MAMDSSWSDELLDLSGFSDDLNDDVTKALAGYDGTNRGDVERDLERLNKRDLEDSREVIFVVAKKKVILCSREEEGGGDSGDADTNETHEQPRRIDLCVNQWKLQCRRKKAKLAYDIMGMVLYATGHCKDFPSKTVRDASLDKGGLDEDTEDEPLANQLSQEVAATTGAIVCELVSKSKDSEIHSITIENTVNGDDDPEKGDDNECDIDEGEPTADTPPVEESIIVCTTPKPVAEDNPPESNPPDTTKEIPVPVAKCPTCGCGCEGRKSVPIVKSTSTSDLKKSARMEMERRLEDDEIPVNRTEFEYYMDFNDSAVADNKKAIDGIIEWREGVQHWMKSLEASYRKELAEVKSQHAAIIAELRNPKQCRRSEASKHTSVEISQTQAPMQDSEGDESVWDFPMEQRTPVKKTVSARADVDGYKPGNNNTVNRTKGLDANEGFDLSKPKQACTDTDINPSVLDLSKKSRERTETESIVEADAPIDYSNPYIVLSDDYNKDSPDVPRGQPIVPRQGRRDNRQVRDQVTREPPPVTRQSNQRKESQPLPRRSPKRPRNPQRGTMRVGNINTYPRDLFGPIVPEAAARAAVPVQENVTQGTSSRSGQPNPNTSARNNTGPPNVTHNDNYSSGSTSTDPDSPTYAETTSKNSWKTAKGQNKRRRLTKTIYKTVPELKASRQSRCIEYYVQGLDYVMCSSHEEFEEIVEVHCKRRGIIPIDVCIIPVYRNKAKAGCKVTVWEEDSNKLNSEGFWPDDASIRLWEDRPRKGKQGQYDNDNGNDL